MPALTCVGVAQPSNIFPNLSLLFNNLFYLCSQVVQQARAVCQDGGTPPAETFVEAVITLCVILRAKTAKI
jgi:hypothetical protein